ncbi:hypothetical protein PLICRDRAFT_153146 [Plicaturopsis crispa FD-325 SS-3]|nr:hypothetical protein PLICRDRAFT_153146 [Plicaturopsis crispa FD-325 SS-3]
MKVSLCAGLSLAALVHSAQGHAGHGEPAEGETVQQYAQRHMSSEHHIDAFDARSFFHLHDLNRDGFWDREEIEAIYGVHHVYSQKKSKDDVEHQKKADFIVKAVLDKMDTSNDGKITPEEFEAVGLDGLPNFDDMGAEGHHYDVESEFFLHHEEEFHSTPETQTDESYNHPEDIEHFGHHEAIERKEAEKEAAFQGISVDEALAAHELEPPSPPSEAEIVSGNNAQQPIVPNDAAHPHVDQADVVPPVQDPSAAAAAVKPKISRVTPPEKQDPSVRFQEAREKAEAQAEWGAGDGGYKPPTSPVDKMRKNLPYKNSRMQYKFRRNWGDF